MIKDKTIITTPKKKNGKINKVIKRIRGIKKSKNTKIKICKRIRKRISLKNEEKTMSLSSEGKTIFSETSSGETNEISHEYKNELIKIINNIKNKYNLEVNNLSENNIINRINDIVTQSEKSKINIILDIDQTLVYSQRITDEKEIIFNYDNSYNDNHQIEFYLENKKYVYFIQVRKGLRQFIEKLSPFCNFYINTMANPIYIKTVLTLLNKKYNLHLNNNGLNNVFITGQKEKKTLPPEITKNGNFLILDDNICAWDKTYLSNIIPVKKFYGSFNDTNSIRSSYDTIYQYYLFSNKIYCFNEQKRQFHDYNNKLPFCSEASWSELNQLDYISDLIIKCYILSKLLNSHIFFSFYNILHNVLRECKIYYDGEDKYFFQELIKLLGGSYVFDIKEATHILIKDNNDKLINELKEYNYNFINIKWLFDSYFNFTKCNEEKYKI